MNNHKGKTLYTQRAADHDRHNQGDHDQYFLVHYRDHGGYPKRKPAQTDNSNTVITT